MAAVILLAAAFIIVYVTQRIYRWRNPKCSGGILPPGSSGFPIIGEALQIVKPSYSLGTPPFISDRIRKYGSLFRTNFAGRRLIISTDAQTNNKIFEMGGELVEAWYIHGFDKLMNASELTEVNKHMRGLVLRQMGVDKLKHNLIPLFQELASTTLHFWSTQDSIELKSATTKAFVEIGAKVIYGGDLSKSAELADKFSSIFKGLTSFPLNIPGTTFHKYIKDREELKKMLADIARARLSSSENNERDLLDLFVQEMKKDKTLTEYIAVGMVFALTIGASEGTAFLLTLAIKFISENPSVLHELKVEHEEILNQREDKGCPISWDDYKSMPFTLQVIKETLRMGTTIPGVFRMVKKDFILNGYTIPKDWVIVPVYLQSHFNPIIFENPLEFNPRRWKDHRWDASKYFNPFGGGISECAGADYTKVIISIFLHVLVTKYRWKYIGGGDILQNPIIQFKTDVRIKVTKRNSNDN